MSATSALNAITNGLNSLPGISEGLKKQLLELVSGQIHKLDLVTREEFEVQRKVLARTRSIVDELQQRIEQLEQERIKVGSKYIASHPDTQAS